jgi:flagellar biosynthetic protein FliR
MDSFVPPTLNQFLVFVLVLTRLSGLFLMVPVFGPRAVPLRVRALLAVGMAALVTPTHWSAPVVAPANLLELAVLVGREAALGMMLGLGVLILLAGLQLAGAIVEQMSGMQLADVLSPSTDTNVPVFSQLLELVALAVFLAIGGHRQVFGALLDSFQWMPPGQVRLSSDWLAALSDLMTQSFSLGIRAAAPVVIALLLAVLIQGLISRTLPQLNVMAVGFSANALLLLATLSLSLGTAAWLFQEQAETAIQFMREAVAP